MTAEEKLWIITRIANDNPTDAYHNLGEILARDEAAGLPALAAEDLALIANRCPIEAIKQYKDRNGCSIMAAKCKVNEYRDQHHLWPAPTGYRTETETG